MHEFAFAEQIYQRVLSEVDKHPGYRVSRIKLRAAQALALEPASLRFCLEAITVGTVMEGVELDMDETGPEMECPNCGRVTIDSILDTVCPVCGSLGSLSRSTELIIEEIELSEQENQT